MVQDWEDKTAIKEQKWQAYIVILLDILLQSNIALSVFALVSINSQELIEFHGAACQSYLTRILLPCYCSMAFLITRPDPLPGRDKNNLTSYSKAAQCSPLSLFVCDKKVSYNIKYSIDCGDVHNVVC